MTLLTKQEIEALLDGTAPGLVDHCLYHCGKRLAECPCMRDLAAKGALTDAAPNLARTALDALARLEDAEAAQALVVERAADEAAGEVAAHGEAHLAPFVRRRIQSLADTSGVAALAALRGEIVRKDQAIEAWREDLTDMHNDNKDLRARLAASEGMVAALTDGLKCARALMDTPIARRKLNLDPSDECLAAFRAALATVTPPADTGEGA